MLKNIKKVEKLNQKNIRTIIIAAICLLLLLIIVLVASFNKTKEVTCTKNNTFIKDFYNIEEVNIRLKRDVIKELEISKTVEITGDYKEFPTFSEILENSLNSAYAYDKDNYKLKKDGSKFTIDYKTKDKSIILNNLEITLNDPDKKYDLKFNTQNNIESAETVLNVNDEINSHELIKKVESWGYSCK